MSDSTTAAAPVQDPVALLRQVDGWLGTSCNHGSSHPLRKQIAATLAAEARAQDKPEPAFQPFAWHKREDEDRLMRGGVPLRFAGRVRDVTAGAAEALAMIEQIGLDDEGGPGDDGRPRQPLLPPATASNLMRWAIVSLHMVSNEANELIDWHHRHGIPAGQARDGVQHG